MTSGARAAARRQRLLADNRCVNCAAKLTFDDIGKRQECASCRDDRSERDDARHEERRAAGKCPQCGEPATDDYAWCAECRKESRSRWERNKRPATRRHNGPQKATRWKDLEVSGERCPRCFLLGDHECIQLNADRRIAQ